MPVPPIGEAWTRTSGASASVCKASSQQPHSRSESARRGGTSSQPSAATRPLLPGPSGEKLQEAPTVEAIGSASYRGDVIQNSRHGVRVHYSEATASWLTRRREVMRTRTQRLSSFY